jgi:glutathione peroxidase-family protein
VQPVRCTGTGHRRAETGGGDITWNFEKFLIGRDGTIIERLSPMVTPEEIEPKLADLL